MQQLPRDVINIIMKYVTDMQLFELAPTPGNYTGSITPLNFDIISGVTIPEGHTTYFAFCVLATCGGDRVPSGYYQ